jgi:DNA polymerase elongation subunit (family B)
MQRVGWLLDVFIRGNEAVLWIKLLDGGILRLTDPYHPDFYGEPLDKDRIPYLQGKVEEHPGVAGVDLEEWYTSLKAVEKTSVLRIKVEGMRSLRRVKEDLEDTMHFKGFYNTGLLPVQRYLYGLGIPATSKVEVDFDGEKLRNLSLLDDLWSVESPPFSVFTFSLEPGSRSGEVLEEIKIYDDSLKSFKILQGDGAELLEELNTKIGALDPDFLVSPQIDMDLNRLGRLARREGKELEMGRESLEGGEFTGCCKGRIPVDLRYYREWGVAGVVERSRFTYASPGLAAKWAAGRTIDSRQCLEALKRRVLIHERDFTVNVTTALETHMRDKGGFTLSPQVGLHTDVAELDYESMYPNIILRENLSYETLEGKLGQGLLGIVAEEPLKRRLYFKELKRELPKGTPEWTWADHRQKALKGILVCIYGYSGCFANRFGNVAVFEEINKEARRHLLETVDIARRLGYRVIYADTDSIFVKKEGATKKEYVELGETISKEAGLPINLDHHYKFLVFVKREVDPRIDVAKRYFGLLRDGGLYYRGIELRRHDTPPFVKEFQEKLIKILFNAENEKELLRESLPRALEHVRETCREVKYGGIDREGLMVTKRLRKEVKNYKSNLPHTTAASLLAQREKIPEKGDLIKFLYLDTGNKNPLKRVIPAKLLEEDWVNYDEEKYVELVIDAAETVLGVFGFDKNQLRKGYEQQDLREVLR